MNTKNLHVAIDVSPISFSRGRRGFRRFVSILMNALAGIRDSNRYTLLSQDKTLNQFLPRGDFRFHVEDPRRRIPMLHRRPSWIGHLGRLFLSDVDVMHFPCTDIWYGVPRGRSVVTLHDFAPLHFPERFFKQAREEKQYRVLLERIAENANFIVTISDSTREEAMKYLKVESRRVRTVYNALDPRLLKKEEPSSKEDLRQRGVRKPFFLFVGGPDFRKNIPLLLEAFSLYRDQGGRANLVLAGWQDPSNPNYYPPLGPLLEKSKYQKDIGWLSQVTDSELPGIYSEALALIFPSQYEGFGMPMVEAMYFGTPVIATRTSCLPEIAGDAALFAEASRIEIAKAMNEIEASQSLRERLIRLGRRRAEFFMPERFAREMIEVYERVSSSP